LNEFIDLYSDPKWFHCDRRAEWVRLERCIGQQQANAETKRPGTPASFPDCVECEQGIWNRQFRGVWTDGTPKRGRGERDTECPLYTACLNIAVEKDWRSWDCESCPYYASGNENRMKTVEKPENTGLCEKCGEKPKFGRSPYCASCMARKSNEARKGKTTKKSTKSRRGRKKAGHSKDKAEKSPPGGDEAALKIDFGKHAQILRQIERLAEEEIRSVESQVIYMLKTYLSSSGEMAQLSGG
jgi:hypothetical protein